MACPTTKSWKIVNATLKLAEIDAANGCRIKGYVDVGDFPMLDLTLNTTFIEDKNSRGRVTVLQARVPNEVSMGAKAKLKEATLANLALMMGGKLETVTGATATDLPFESGIVVGDEVLMPGYPSNVTSVSIKDSAGSPLTLTLSTHYTIDAQAGTVKFVAIPGTQPYKITYTAPTRSLVSLLRNDAVGKAYQALIIGENALANYEKTKIILFRVQPSPTASFVIKDASSTSGAEFEIELTPVADLSRSADASNPLGQYGIIEVI